jgi:TolB-like protein
MLLLSLLLTSVYAQGDTAKPNIAVVPFMGDKNVTAEQLNFLSGKFAGELINTKTFRVLDRGQMEVILKEQGFQQSGACNSSECQVQMGQLLGVDVIIAGNLVRFGTKYAFRADYIEVKSGQVLFAAEFSQTGELEDVYERLCQVSAKELAYKYQQSQGIAIKKKVAVVRKPKPMPSEVAIPEPEQPKPIQVEPQVEPMQPAKPLSLKRKFAIALWGTSALGIGSGMYFDSKGATYLKDFNTAESLNNAEELRRASKNLNDAESFRNASYGVSIGSGLLGLVLWFWPEEGN